MPLLFKIQLQIKCRNFKNYYLGGAERLSAEDLGSLLTFTPLTFWPRMFCGGEYGGGGLSLSTETIFLSGGHLLK